MFKFLTFLVALAVLSSCKNKADSLPPPMVDGKLDDFKQLKIEPISISENVDLYIYQDDFFVWLGYDYPEGSYGTLDLQIDTDNFEKPINLHVSAQLGEWEVGNESQQPQTSTSDLWWEFKGWTANEVWMNGIDRSGERANPKFKNAQAREIQLSKQRFGKGTWKLKFNIRAIKNQDGVLDAINFPEDGSDYELMVY